MKSSGAKNGSAVYTGAPDLSHTARNGMMCALLFAAAFLIAHPFAEMGFIDDFAYIKTAQRFAETGHFIYNGWETAMLGWLVPWGALFIKLFGFSFTITRMATFAVATLCVALFHASLRRFGIGPRDAVLGTLTVAFCPLFFPLSASFMTDVPGFFVILLTLYLCQRADAACSRWATIAWLASAALANVVGGTVRQHAWLGALVMVPSTAFHIRNRAGVKAAAAALWVLSLAAIVYCLHWFGNQPYTLKEKVFQGVPSPHQVAHLGVEFLKAFLCLMLVVTPVLVPWFRSWRDLPVSAKLRIGGVVGVLSGVAAILWKRGTLEHRVMPWLAHVVGTLSIFPVSGEMLGQRPVTLGMPSRVVLSLVVVAAILTVLETALSRSVRRRHIPDISASRIFWLLIPFSISFALFLIPRALYSTIYDRYLLGLLPVTIVLLLVAYRRWAPPSRPGVSIYWLGAFALYTIAGTHDWFALNRARAAAVAEVRRSGVPVTRIQGGFDFDGWTQIEAAGYINDERITKPAGAYRPYVEPNKLPRNCQLQFAPFTPAIQPVYFIVFEPMPCLAASQFKPIEYRTWLPPFQREVFTERLPGLGD